MQETWQQELRFQSYNMVQKDTMRIATVYGSSLSARYALGTAVAETDDVSSWHKAEVFGAAAILSAFRGASAVPTRRPACLFV